MEWGSDEVMVDKTFANISGSAAWSLRMVGRRIEAAIGASASQIPRRSLSERIARISEKTVRRAEDCAPYQHGRGRARHSVRAVLTQRETGPRLVSTFRSLQRARACGR